MLFTTQTKQRETLASKTQKKEVFMKPLEIRIALMRAGVRQSDIAKTAGVTAAHVACVLDRK